MLGKRINELRIAFGWNQVQLAERLNISKQTVSNWENERSYPDIRSLLLLSVVFGISLDILVKGDVEQMKVQIKEEEIRMFRKESLTYGLLLGATILLAIPMVKLLGWFGVMLWCGLIAVALVQSIRVEKLKKQHDIQTYREILAFLDGKRLDEVEYQREVGKRPYQRIALAVLTGLVSFLVCLLLGWLL